MLSTDVKGKPITITERVTSDDNFADDVFSEEYPFMVDRDCFVSRQNIINYCKQITQININRLTLSKEDRNTIDQLENLILH